MITPDSIAVIVLAAGQSKRFGENNKLLECMGGRTLIEISVASALQSKAGQVIVVTGFEDARIRTALPGYDVTFVDNERYRDGISSSISCGVAAVPEQVRGAVIMLADMTGIRADHLDRMIDAFINGDGQQIVLPVFKGQRGNPVLWPRSQFQALMDLHGDMGGRALLQGLESSQLCRVEMSDDAIFFDVDKTGDLNPS